MALQGPSGADGAAADPAGGGAERRGAGSPVTPYLDRAVYRGLGFLAGHQHSSGGFGDSFPVAADALVGLAFLAGGNTTREGTHASRLRALVTHLKGLQNSDGYFDDGQSRMYGHGFATLFLAELYGMSRDPSLKECLRRALNVIEESQCPVGGWNYWPRPQGPSDSSITVCQTMALRAARNVGIEVDGAVISRARDYIRKAQNSDGGFSYRIGPSGGLRFSDFPRSAAGVCILYGLGEYRVSDTSQGIEYLYKRYRRWDRWPYYAHYYAAQAFFQAGGKYWAEYFPWIRDRLVSEQRADGSWQGAPADGGVFVATGMALIVLQIPHQFLPILER